MALIDARRAIKMFQQVNVPVAGIIENMSYFLCPHCNEKSEIFSHGGGEKTAERYQVPLLGKIPLDMAIREGADSGLPIVEAAPESEHAIAFKTIAGAIAGRISVLALA